jgi:nucleotide-binding universal stress UspA family protein
MKTLVSVDFSEATEKFMKTVEDVALALSARLWLLHVAEPEPDFVGFKIGPKYIRDFRSEMFHSEHRQLQAFAERLRKAGLETTALLVQGATVECILKEASRLDVDMIVLGSHGRGAIHRLMAGCVSEAVLRKSECPVFVVPTHGHHTSPAVVGLNP